MKKALDWLDDRSGYRAALAGALEEPVAGGASYVYMFGSILTFILVMQMVTGVFLAMYYSPSATDAWASVAYIQDSVTMGWFIRGLHSYGASAMVIVAGMHLLQTAIWGAYKRPRELNWITGVAMLGLILAFALTGYLLPWDQTGYWATKVATGIAGTTPLVGEQVQQVAQAGNEYGNLTLTRFFAIHVFILPATIIGLVVMHIALFRRHGVTPRWGRAKGDLERTTQPFWPDQLFKDVVGMAVVFAVLVAVTLQSHGAKLDAPADPASNFDARPEWYFLPLFQILKYFEGVLEHLVALGMPLVVGIVLIGLPFVDRKPDRSPRARLPYLAVIALGFIGAGAFTAISILEDRADPKLQERIAESEELATKARELAATYGVPPAGGVAVFTTEPWYRARQLWNEHCKSCHEDDPKTPENDRKGPAIGPGYNSRPWIRGFLRNPSGDAFFGVTEGIDGMEPVELTGADLDAVVELVYAQTGDPEVDRAMVTRGNELFEENCTDCHPSAANDDPVTGELSDWSAPDVRGRGSADHIAAFLHDPGALRFFGEGNEMPKFRRPKLGEDDRYRLAEYLIWLRTATPEAEPEAEPEARP